MKKYNLKEKTELILENGNEMIQSISNPRKGWEASFQEMNENSDDMLLIDDVFEEDTL